MNTTAELLVTLLSSDALSFSKIQFINLPNQFLGTTKALF